MAICCDGNFVPEDEGIFVDMARKAKVPLVNSLEDYLLDSGVRPLGVRISVWDSLRELSGKVAQYLREITCVLRVKVWM